MLSPKKTLRKSLRANTGGGKCRNFECEFHPVKKAVDRFLLDSVRRLDCSPKLKRSLTYSLFPGGRRLRPLFAMIVAKDLKGSAEEVLPVACAVELVHSYSLVHDDLPAMDNDDYRRGKPTVHRKFDEATAILCGDALLTLAFELIADSNISGELKAKCSGILARGAGSAGMIDGQVIDLFNRHGSWNDFETLYRKKTGQLFSAAFGCAAAASGAGDAVVEKCLRAGETAGILYQICDDIKDSMAEVSSRPKRLALAEPNLVDAMGKDFAVGKAEYMLGRLKNMITGGVLRLNEAARAVGMLFDEFVSPASSGKK